MMNDALRAAKVMPAFREAVVLHLVEISPALEEQQERTLEHLPTPMYWHPRARRRAEGPRHHRRQRILRRAAGQSGGASPIGWHERQIEIDAAGNLAFTVAPDAIAAYSTGCCRHRLRDGAGGSIFEWRADTVGDGTRPAAGARRRRRAGDRLRPRRKRRRRHLAGGRPARFRRSAERARQHRSHRACRFPGAGQAVEAMGANGFGPLDAVAVPAPPRHRDARHSLKAKATGTAAADIDAALARLIGEGRGRHGCAVQGRGLRAPCARRAARIRDLGQITGNYGADRHSRDKSYCWDRSCDSDGCSNPLHDCAGLRWR